MAQLESARAKLGRARELMAEIGDLVTNQLPWPELDRSVGAMAATKTYTLALEDAPVRVALLVGDALQNLNSALDHASWELARPECRDRGLLFPAISAGTRESESATRRRLEDHLARYPTPIANALRAIQPIDRGADQDRTQLAVLKSIAGEERHRVRRILPQHLALLGGSSLALDDSVGAVFHAQDGTPLPAGGIEVLISRKIVDAAYPGVAIQQLLGWLYARVDDLIGALEQEPPATPVPCDLMPTDWRP